MEMKLEIPAKSTVIMNLDFDKTLLRYTEYPPDANRGFDIGSGTVTVVHTVERDLLRSIWTLHLQQR